MNPQRVILFDGVCNFCNSSVNFVLKRNAKKNIMFAPLQSAAGQKLLQSHNMPVDGLQSVIFIEGMAIYERSTAALRICRQLNGLWPLFYGLIVVPRFIRDGVYNWIANNRYTWFGRRQECMIPSPDVKARFLA